MRISDWSSDVCSSDLRRAPRRRAPATSPLRPGGSACGARGSRPPPSCRPRASCCPLRSSHSTSCPSQCLTRQSPDSSPGRAVFPQFCLKVRPQLHQRLVVHGAHRLRVDADDLGRLARRHVALVQRSEEHTSELQSLLSISYAVFCSKKKKTKNT